MSAPDPAVVAAAYSAATKLNASPKVMLALFEAGLVESNFQNYTKATDHDSLGYLQQRPSAGWKSPTNIAVATKSFVDKANAKLKANPNYTAGQLAQAVQVSAYPLRYQQAQSRALALLKQASGGQLDAAIADVARAAGDAAANVAANRDPLTSYYQAAGAAQQSLASSAQGLVSTAQGLVAPIASVGKLADILGKLALPTNLVRLGAGVAGSICVLIGVLLLAREVKNG